LLYVTISIINRNTAHTRSALYRQIVALQCIAASNTRTLLYLAIKWYKDIYTKFKKNTQTQIRETEVTNRDYRQ